MLSSEEVLKQSESAFRQWGETWKKHARANGQGYRERGRTYKDLLYTGAGHTMLCCAFSPSFEENMDLIVKYKDNVLISCVDKCFGYLIDAGAPPKYVFIADAGISYEKWCEPWIDKTEDIILLMNITGNPLWAQNWKGPVYYYVNKDNIQSEEIFMYESADPPGSGNGCKDMIPASSNVGNTVLVFSTQVLGCDRYLLVGYDYGWRDDQKYYAYNDSDKRYWMKHANVIDTWGNMVNTSQNLLFSSRWLADFGLAMRQQNVPIFNCCGQGILNMPRVDLEKMLQVATKRELGAEEKKKILNARVEEIPIRNSPDAPERLQDALKNHNIVEVAVRHVPKEVTQWLS